MPRKVDPMLTWKKIEAASFNACRKRWVIERDAIFIGSAEFSDSDKRDRESTARRKRRGTRGEGRL